MTSDDKIIFETYQAATRKPNPYTDEAGIIRYEDENGRAHRDDGPSVIFPSGATAYHKHGWLHRTDGPAVGFANGKGEYYLNGYDYAGNLKLWAQDVLGSQGKPSEDEDIENFLRQIYKKQLSSSL